MAAGRPSPMCNKWRRSRSLLHIRACFILLLSLAKRKRFEKSPLSYLTTLLNSNILWQGIRMLSYYSILDAFLFLCAAYHFFQIKYAWYSTLGGHNGGKKDLSFHVLDHFEKFWRGHILLSKIHYFGERGYPLLSVREKLQENIYPSLTICWVNVC